MAKQRVETWDCYKGDVSSVVSQRVPVVDVDFNLDIGSIYLTQSEDYVVINTGRFLPINALRLDNESDGAYLVMEVARDRTGMRSRCTVSLSEISTLFQRRDFPKQESIRNSAVAVSLESTTQEDAIKVCSRLARILLSGRP